MPTKAELYSEYLRLEGYLPETEENGDIRFKVEGETFVIAAMEEDPSFFKLSYFHRWDPESTAATLPLVNALNAHFKVAKVVILNDVLGITTETLLKSPEDFADVFRRCLTTISMVKANLASGLQQLAAAAQTAQP